MGKYVLAIDQGTTGSTALLFDPEARLVGRAYSEFNQYYPQPGWVEHDPEQIWNVSLRLMKEAMASAKTSPRKVGAIGITNQRETTVVWDRKTGVPIHRAIVWQCRRTARECEKLKKKGLARQVQSRTGLVLDPYFSGTKIAWILDHVPNARKRAENGELAFGTIDSWLLWNLTGGRVHATDATNASRTLLYDVHRREWSDRLCKALNVPRNMLPQVRASSTAFGQTSSEHFGGEIPISGIAGDQQAALFGHYATSPGQAKCTFGTGAFAVAFSGNKKVVSKSGLLTTLACDSKGKPAYALEGSIFMAGAIIQWLRDELKIIEKASDTEEIARSVDDTGGTVLVPAFVGLGAPYWDASARAALVGMTRGTSRAHIVRAALEAIAFQTSDLIDAMAQDLRKPLRELRVDGGATANNFLMQFLADLIGIPVVRPAMIEMTGFGAARLAAVSAGLWEVSDQPADRPTRFEPKLPDSQRQMLKARWTEAVDRVRSKRKRT